jgi:hypothetical protein
MRPDDPLDQILLGFSDEDPFTIRDAFEGVQIFGSVGSGKTSGSGALFARAYLAAGFGGLVLTAKVDETDLWRRYARETGREDDLIVIGPKAEQRFNFITYEANHPDAEAGLTENIVRLFETVSGSVGGVASRVGTDDQFWTQEYRKLLRNAIDLLILAGRPVTLENIHMVIMDAPLSLEKIEDENWRADSFHCEVLEDAYARRENGEMSDEEKNTFRMTVQFWTRGFPTQPEKTRATVLSIFTGMSDVFLRGMLHRIFSTDTTVTPEASLEGKVIVLDLPEKRFHELGVAAQTLFKFCWQRSIERRKIEANSKPVFLWMDESQLFVNRHDVGFQATARSARVATVFLTQNIPNYYASMGGENASKAFVESLMGNMGTKIFHNNNCSITNQYASELFAKDWRSVVSYGTTTLEGKLSQSSSQDQQLEYTVLPRAFTTLATGGPNNDFIVEGIVHRSGRIFNCSGRNALQSVFKQTMYTHA